MDPVSLPTRPSSYAATHGRRAAWIVWCVLTLVALVQVGRLTAFMVDSSRGAQSIYPFDRFFVTHSCLTAYVGGAELARADAPNVYEPTAYEGKVDGFAVDGYLYPPPFLLCPASSFPSRGASCRCGSSGSC